MAEEIKDEAAAAPAVAPDAAGAKKAKAVTPAAR